MDKTFIKKFICKLRAMAGRTLQWWRFSISAFLGSTGTDGPSLNMHENDRIWRYVIQYCNIMSRSGYWPAARASASAHTTRTYVRTYNINYYSCCIAATHACANSLIYAHLPVKCCNMLHVKCYMLPVKCCYMLHARTFKPQTWRELSCHLGNHVTPGGWTSYFWWQW